MNSNKLIFLNIGWKKYYRGLPPESDDSIIYGGEHVDKEGWGHEIYNFLPVNGKMYGFVETRRKKDKTRKSIRIEKIEQALKGEDKIDNVLVIWTARRNSKYNDPLEERGCFIIGWYKNATVYRYYQHDLNRCYQSDKMSHPEKCGYFVVAMGKDCTLIEYEKQRTFKVSRAAEGNYGFFGQSNIWFADSEIPKVIKFREDVIEYISNY
jgi:hypothetical protein